MNERPSLQLRMASAEDRPFLLQLYASTRAAELALTGWDSTSCEAFVRMQFDLQARSYQSRYPQAEAQVIELHSSAHTLPIGRLWCAYSDKAVHVLDISLLPAHRGVGHGSACLRRLQARARQAGLPIELHVDLSNPARRLYERMGFEAGESDGMYLSMRWRAAIPSLLETCDEKA